MQIPLQISWHGVEHTAADERDIREHVDRLERYYDRIVGCSVTVEAPHRHHKTGNPFAVKVVLSVPQSDVVVNHDASGLNAETLHVAIRDAFEAARRQLRQRADRHRSHVKRHQRSIEPGRIASTFPDEDFGFINTPDGVEVMFHRNAIVGAELEDLEVGTPVRFHRESGDSGPRATVVRVE